METRSTIAELLADITLTKRKIEKGMAGISNDSLVGIYKGPTSQILIDGSNADDFEANARKSYDQVRSLTENLRKMIALKGMVNDRVTVKIAGQEYTINQALGFLSNDVKSHYDELKNLMNRAIVNSKSRVSRYNQEALSQEMINNYLKVCLGSQSIIDETRKTNPDEIQGYIDKYTERNTSHVFDPLGIEKEYAKLCDWYDSFYGTAEKVLAVVNAQTMIIYDLDDEVPAIHKIIYAKFDEA